MSTQKMHSNRRHLTGDGNPEELPPIEVSALLTELERADAERHSAWATFGSLLGAALVTGGALLAFEAKDKPLEPELVESLIWLALTIIPLFILASVVELFARHVAVSYYTRLVERQIWSITGPTEAPIPLPSLEAVNASLAGNRRGLWEIKTIHLSAYLAISGVIAGSSVIATTRITHGAVALAGYGAIALMTFVIVRLAARATIHGNDMWSTIERQVAADAASPFPRPDKVRDERSLLAYLVVPRPNELLVKGIALHSGAALVGVWLARGIVDIGFALSNALTTFVCFEFLTYQARYMYNDYRGRNEDQANPAAKARRRLPLRDSDSAVRKNAFWLTLAARLGFAAWLAYHFDGRWRWILGGLLIVTWALAGVYERLRSHRDRGFEPADGWPFSGIDAAIYFTVGISYSIRAGFGIFIGADGSISIALLLATCLAFYFSGLANVLMAWALEATLYTGRRSGDAWAMCRASTATSGAYYLANSISATVKSKWHLFPLARQAGVLDPCAAIAPDPIPDEAMLNRNVRLLDRKTSLRLVWNAAFVAACGFAGIVGWLGHQGIATNPSPLSTLTAGVAGTCIGIACVRFPATVLGSIGACGAVLAGWLWWQDRSFDLVFGVIPLIAVVITYVTTRPMTYDETIGFVDTVLSIPGEVSRFAVYAAKELIR